jgi:hypothetical protein
MHIYSGRIRSHDSNPHNLSPQGHADMREKSLFPVKVTEEYVKLSPKVLPSPVFVKINSSPFPYIERSQKFGLLL